MPCNCANPALTRYQAFSAREGIALSAITYDDDGELRPLFYRLSLAEMVVPYGEPIHPHPRKVRGVRSNACETLRSVSSRSTSASMALEHRLWNCPWDATVSGLLHIWYELSFKAAGAMAYNSMSPDIISGTMESQWLSITRSAYTKKTLVCCTLHLQPVYLRNVKVCSGRYCASDTGHAISDSVQHADFRIGGRAASVRSRRLVVSMVATVANYVRLSEGRAQTSSMNLICRSTACTINSCKVCLNVPSRRND